MDQSLFRFKFRWVDDNGNETGFLKKSGWFNGETLQLDDMPIPVAALTDVQIYDQRMVIAGIDEDGDVAMSVVRLYGVPPQQLKSVIDISRSANWAELAKEQLEKEGRGHAFRSEICPRCSATLILTDMPRTPQLYCHFCESLTTFESAGAVIPNEQDYKLCEECGMYSRPRKFTVFYFYFLVVVFGYHQRITWRCPACMRGDAWKMLFGNLLFVVGVPVAITQLVRCYGGGITGGPTAGLDAANLKARKGDVLGALDGYRVILENVPVCAGVKYNVGLALAQQGETGRAAESLRLAFDDCSNYVPAYRVLAACYEELGETERLAELNRIWEVEDSEPESLDEALFDPV